MMRSENEITQKEETKMTENALMLAGYDLSELTPEEQKQLMEMYKKELQVSQEGIDLQPIRFKINKDSCTFLDPFGNGHSEIRGVIVYKHKMRGYWDRTSDDTIPECSSWDGRVGITRDGLQRECTQCPYNAWGSGVDEAGNQTRGKACKEMRRLFIALADYHLPVMISLPPTSIKNFDSYISARLTKGIPDIAAETIISLVTERGGKYSYAVAQFKMGDKVPPKRMLELNKLRSSIEAAASRIGIEDEDYIQGNGDIDDEAEPF